MRDSAELKNLERILIVGAARSGAAAALMTRRILPHVEVLVCDRSSEPAPGEDLAALSAAGIALRLGSEDNSLLDGCNLVIKSPGVPGDISLVEEAHLRGIPVWGEIEFAWRFLQNPVVGVTGTNGKTTTTELIGHILREAGWACRVAGNVGTALSSLVGEVGDDDILVLELSSFQLEDSIDFRPEVAVLLNLTEDHLDRHPSAPEYFAAKMKIFSNQRSEDLAIFNQSDPAVRAAGVPGSAARAWFGLGREQAPGSGMAGGEGLPAAVFAENDVIRADLAALAAAGRGVRERVQGAAREAQGSGGNAEGRNAAGSGEDLQSGFEDVIFWPEAALRGVHNLENSLAATAVCLSLGLTPDHVAAGLKSFPGVPHRLQQVAVVGGVTYVNDSKATNVDAAVKALTAFESGIHLILGGSLKGCSFDELAEAASGERVKEVIALGQAATEIAASFSRAGREVLLVDGLEDAVKAAAGSAVSGDVVLLAPACASYDQYENFERRGEHFISLVNQMTLGEG